MWQAFLTLVIDRILEALKEGLQDWLKWQKKAKQNQKESNDIIKIKDRKDRAAAMSNFLNR